MKHAHVVYIATMAMALCTGCRTPDFTPEPTLDNQLYVRPGEVELGVDFSLIAEPGTREFIRVAPISSITWRAAILDGLTYVFPFELRLRLFESDRTRFGIQSSINWFTEEEDSVPDRPNRFQWRPRHTLNHEWMIDERMMLITSLGVEWVYESFDSIDGDSRETAWFERTSARLTSGIVWNPVDSLFIRPAITLSWDEHPQSGLTSSYVVGRYSDRPESLYVGLTSTNSSGFASQPLIQLVIANGWYIYERSYVFVDVSKPTDVFHEHGLGVGRYF